MNPLQKSPPERFIENLPQNGMMAFATVPIEKLALTRVLHVMRQETPKSYTQVIKEEGYNGLFCGAFARTTYCLVGNYATLQGIQWFGSDLAGLFNTAVVKNAILPFSLWSNAAQASYSTKDTIISIVKGCKNPLAHTAFFARNLLSNACLYPGFKVRDACYQKTEDLTLSNAAGFSTTLSVSATLNAFVKPLFTAGSFTNKTRLLSAWRLPGLFAIAVRESVSALFQFTNTSPNKRQ